MMCIEQEAGHSCNRIQTGLPSKLCVNPEEERNSQ